MSSNSVLPSYPIFNDIDGSPLDSGFIYIGTAGLNPEISPVNIYLDSDLTIPVAQPVRTIGGYPINAGSPIMVYVDGDYSITVRNKNGTLIYSSLYETREVNLDKYAIEISKVSRALYVKNTSGVADTLTLSRPDTTIAEVSAYYDGLTLMFDNTLSNTGAVTATLDALSSKKVRTAADTDLVANDIIAGVTYFIVYNSALDSGAGAFELKDVMPENQFAKLWDPQTVTYNMASDADYTLTSDQNLYGRIIITDTGVLLTAARNIIVDTSIRLFTLLNETAQDLTVKTLAGTGILIKAGQSANLYCDGTNVVNWISTNALTGNISTNDFLHVSDQQVAGTNGGTSLTGDNLRVLNTVITNTIIGASLATNQVTLPAGTYFIEGRAPAWGSDTSKIYLKNVTDTTNDIIGSTHLNSNATGVQSDSKMTGIITIAATKVFELRHFIQTGVATYGLGRTGVATIGVETFAELKIWKIG